MWYWTDWTSRHRDSVSIKDVLGVILVTEQKLVCTYVEFEQKEVLEFL